MAVRGAKNKKVETVEAQQVLEAVKNLDTGGVVAEVNNLQVSLQSKLADISASITNKIQQIDTIDKAIALKEGRLKELYGIEAEAVKLDDLKAQFEAVRQQWEIEALQNEQDNEETRQARMKERVRAEEEWQYEFERKKKQAEDTFNLQLNDALQAEERRQRDLEQQWASREKVLKDREAELAELRKLADSFESRVKQEVGKAEAVLTNVLKKHHDHEKALLAKDAESAKAVCEMRVKALQDALEQQRTQADDLKVQLAAARQDAKEVAAQALQASSDRKVAEALRQVVDSREQNQGKQK